MLRLPNSRFADFGAFGTQMEKAAETDMITDNLAAALDYARGRHADILHGFKTLLRFPSISQEQARQADLLECAEWIAAQMRLAGLDNVRLLPTAGNPIVYGDWLQAGADQPTILLYAHYDVQPIADAALWHTPPFQPTVSNGRLIARGAVDDKCGVWIVLKAIESILAACGRLPVNIKCLFEGEEELGSKNTIAALDSYRDLLAADALIICDGPFSPSQPGIGVSVRGAVQGELRVTGPPQDLHSGRYGGAVRNPIHSLARIIAALHDSEGRVRLPGFYDQAIQAPAVELAADADLQMAAGVDAFFGEALGSFALRTTMLPTLDVGGISGGYSGEGLRAIIPSEASCKLTLRTVPGQDGAQLLGEPGRACRGFPRAGHRYRSQAAQHRPSFRHGCRRTRSDCPAAGAGIDAGCASAAAASWRLAGYRRRLGATIGCARQYAGLGVGRQFARGE